MLQNATQSKNIVEFPSHFFDQAMSLMHEAQHYFDTLAFDKVIESNPKLWLQYSTEMSVVTLRLASIISWFIERKKMTVNAVADGESHEGGNIPIKGRFIGSIHNPDNMQGLPPYLKYLLESSHVLFMQAINVEDQNDALKEVHPKLTLVKS